MDETCDADDSKQPGPDLPRRIPRLSKLPTREAVLGWLSTIHQDSRVLKRLPAVRQWSAALSYVWSAACKEFTSALDGGNDLGVQALLDLIELPFRILPRDAQQALSWPATASVDAELRDPAERPPRPAIARARRRPAPPQSH
jgi:hypothetical protein